MASIGAIGLTALPPATIAHADSYESIGLYWGGSYSLVPDADGGTFRLMSKSKTNQCLTADDGDFLADTPCDSTSHWNLQPNAAGDKWLVRHTGDNKCMIGSGFALTDCNNSEVDAFDFTSSTLPKQLMLSRKAAIGLGENHVTICNHGGYVARAVIDYKVQTDPDSDSGTSGRRVIPSFPAGQCRTETLPAGRVFGNVELRRFTFWYTGNYAFYDGDAGSYGGSSNDQLTANWAFTGDHIDGTYNTTGTTCTSDSDFAPTSSNQAATQKKDGATACTGVNPAKFTSDILAQVFSKVFPMLLNLVFG
ncbi:hypothetical protein OG754_08620 [Streptomyces decoyicus]|uniref:hypothetical protein n=1 Tax=Streptomyces decoyicus TaxID=249567 RepID=UPI002E327E20|nr:hypothetical protein [Streptomyces decoyicus]